MAVGEGALIEVVEVAALVAAAGDSRADVADLVVGQHPAAQPHG